MAVLRPAALSCVLLLVSTLARIAHATFSVESAGIRIVSPAGHKDRINWALADFGEPKYGGLLLGRAVYLTEDPQYYVNASVKRPKCSEDAPEAQYACVPYDEKCGQFHIQKERGVQYIALVDRGPELHMHPCFFVMKVYHAQQAGADAVLVVNNVDGDDLSTAIVPDEEMFQRMAANISISAGLISKANGALIKSLLLGGKQVTLALNWTDVVPKRQTVQWELWTNTNDECGTACNQQLDFVKAMKPVAKQLQEGGRAMFTPHYVTWACTEEALGSPSCNSMCIRGGRYCAQDPDEDISSGYSGRDVLAINMRQLCFFRLANASGQPNLWWDYVSTFAANCPMASRKYNAECAMQVFESLGGPALLDGHGTAEWQKCVPDVLNETYTSGTARIPVFEEELERQYGNENEKGITLVPTVRILGKEYRGKLDVSGVTRALCAAFPAGTEPALCNELWVSENECEAQAVGYGRCRVGEPESQGRNRCVNTFLGAGYTCQCGQGWVLMSDPATGQQSCEDLNECQATSIIQSRLDCSCERCACINTIGSFNCTGPLPDRCTPQYSYNGCWKQVDASGAVVQHACSDDITTYQADAAMGRLGQDQTWATCKCPHCGSGDGITSCSACADECIESLNECRKAPKPPPSSGGGTGAGAITMIVLLSVLGMSVLMFAAYHFVLRARMDSEIRSIMSQYVTLPGQAPGPGPNPGPGNNGSGAAYTDPWQAPPHTGSGGAAPSGNRRGQGGAGRRYAGGAGEEELPLMLGPSADPEAPSDRATIERGGSGGAQWLAPRPGFRVAGAAATGVAAGVRTRSGEDEGVALAPLSSSSRAAPDTPATFLSSTEAAGAADSGVTGAVDPLQAGPLSNDSSK